MLIAAVTSSFSFSLRSVWFIFFVHCPQPILNIQPQQRTILFFIYLYYNITLNIPTCFDPQVVIFRKTNKSNMVKNKISQLYTQLVSCKRVRLLKLRYFFKEYFINILDLDVQYIGGNLCTETCRNTQSDIILQITKEQYCAFCWLIVAK